MQLSTQIPKQERVQPKGNWMQLTIAPLVEERLEASRREESRSVVGAAGRAGLADNDPV